jgi:hypothetical protein
MKLNEIYNTNNVQQLDEGMLQRVMAAVALVAAAVTSGNVQAQDLPRLIINAAEKYQVTPDAVKQAAASNKHIAALQNLDSFRKDIGMDQTPDMTVTQRREPIDVASQRNRPVDTVTQIGDWRKKDLKF